MRDAKRIPSISAKLIDCWTFVPDWRFGQQIENLKRYAGYSDLYYVGDDKFEEILTNFLDDLTATYGEE